MTDKKRIPNLRITPTGGRSLGRCYSASYYEVVSTIELSPEKLREIRVMGFLGYGQEFRPGVAKQMPESEVYDPAVYTTHERGHVFVYECESRVDSSD
jgi:hypothetical protein